MTVEAAEVVVATMFPKAAKGMSSLFFTNPMTPTIDEPTEPQGPDRQDSFICQKYFRDRDRVIAEKVILEGALHGLFVLLWGQCSPGIQNKLRVFPDLPLRKESGDCAWLLNEIRQLMYEYSSTQYPLLSVMKAKADLMSCKQEMNQSMESYYAKFIDKVHAVEYSNGTDAAIIKYVKENVDEITDKAPPPVPVRPSSPDLGDRVAKDPFSFVVEKTTSSFSIASVVPDASKDTDQTDESKAVDAYILGLRAYDRAVSQREEAVAAYDELVNITARNMYLGLLFIQNANSTYNKYKETLRSDFIDGFFRYPVSVEDAMSKLLENQTVHTSSRHQGGSSNRNNVSGSGTSGGSNGSHEPSHRPRSGIKTELSFFETDAIVPGTDGKTHPTVTCWKCKGLGHYAPECPHQETSTNVELLQVNEETANDGVSIEGDNGNYALSFSQVRTAGPPFSLPPQSDLRSSFIMDSGSSIHSFTNSDFLTNIRTAPDPITSFTNGGTTTYSLIGTFAGVLDVWFNPDGLTNIISLARLSELGHVHYDSDAGSFFTVTLNDGRIWKFARSKNGLFEFVHDGSNNLSNDDVTDYCFITTVIVIGFCTTICTTVYETNVVYH